MSDDWHSSLWVWQTTGWMGKGYITWDVHRLAAEGPFTNPARMIEDMRPGEDAEWNERLWRSAGWWD